MKETATDMQPMKDSGSSKRNTPAEESEAERDAYIKKFGNKRFQIDPDFVLRKIAGTRRCSGKYLNHPAARSKPYKNASISLTVPAHK